MNTAVSIAYRQQVYAELKGKRLQFTGTDTSFAIQHGINPSVFSTMKTRSQLDGLLRDEKWLLLGRDLGIHPNGKRWNLAQTEVFRQIREDVTFCKENSKAMIFVDAPEIGKTVAAKYLSRNIENCFYVDCSQNKGKRDFIRAFARAIGVESLQTASKVKEGIKNHLIALPNPIVIFDEAGDLDYAAFLELKEFWNATEGFCGYYMMGADGLKKKFERGIENQRVGYRELLSRYSNNYQKIVPVEDNERKTFYGKLITDVLSVNCKNKSVIADIVKQCTTKKAIEEMSALRRAESLLILSQ